MTTVYEMIYDDDHIEIRIDTAIRHFNEYISTLDNTMVQSYEHLKLRNFEIGGFKAVEYGYDEKSKKKEIEEQGDAMRHGASVGVIYFPKGIMVNQNGTIIEISTQWYTTDFKEVFDQILSTFKFIE